VLFFVCLLGGLAAFARIPVEYYPDVTLNSVAVNTVWLGASAEEVERLVTQKLEEELSAVEDIQEMRSVSQADQSEIIIDFEETLDDDEYESAVNDVRAALDRVVDLPVDAEEPFLFELIASAPVIFLAVVDEGGVGPLALREVSRSLERELERYPGVQSVEIRGAQDREIRVLVDRPAAARYGLTVTEVAERIRRRNMNLPAGTFASGGGEATVRAQGDYADLQEILDTVVAEREGGSLVRLREIAQLESGLEEARFLSYYDGQPAQLLQVTKEDDVDALEIVAGLDEWIARRQAAMPEGIRLQKTLDTADFIRPRMGVLVDNLATGVVLVVLILWFTIGFRNALLTSISIPFSFLTAMIFFPMLGISINATTLMGMLLVSGMLVDDAIIVLENIYRRIEEGEPLRAAVTNGANEVMWPVICAVTTTCAAFAPLLLVEGTAGKFVSILPKAVLVCLIASLAECLIILPAHYLDFGSRRRVVDGEGTPTGRGSFARVSARFHAMREATDRGIAAARNAYVRALEPMLAHRLRFAVAMALLVFLTHSVSKHLDVVLFPGEYDTLNVLLESPPHYSLQQTAEVVERLQVPLLEYVGNGARDLSFLVGTSVDSNYDMLAGPNVAMSFLVMDAESGALVDSERQLIEIKERVDAWRAENPEGIAELRVQARQDGPPIGPPVEVRIESADYLEAKAVAGEIKAYLHTLPGVFGIEDNLKLGPQEVRVRLDEQRAARYQVGFEDVATALRGANDGLVASSFRSPEIDEDIDIRVMLAARYRENLGDLLDTELRTPSGSLVKLRDVADVELTRGFLSFRRYDEQRTVSVYADVDTQIATSTRVNEDLKARFADIPARYPGVTIRYGGEFEATGEAFADLLSVFPIAFLAIYMILAALFRSYMQPLIVTAAIPFAFVGVIFGVAIMQYEVSFILMYATIGLTGVVVNDSLVMVDFINRARERGTPLEQAVRESGAMRFRPILLTTLTTVIALMPMALGVQGSSKTYGPFAAAISFGLMFAMVGTLFAVPVAYIALIEGQAKGARVWARWRGRPLPAPGEERAAPS
jgi:HAE1 family hydrophobic/amphiphilic exporter-1